MFIKLLQLQIFPNLYSPSSFQHVIETNVFRIFTSHRIQVKGYAHIHFRRNYIRYFPTCARTNLYTKNTSDSLCTTIDDDATQVTVNTYFPKQMLR